MMGVGKSTIGRSLASKLSYKFLDIDELIEKKEGSSINLIFKKKGENYFRKIENEITDDYNILEFYSCTAQLLYQK